MVKSSPQPISVFNVPQKKLSLFFDALFKQFWVIYCYYLVAKKKAMNMQEK